MYNLRNKANKGFKVDLKELVKNQNKCWLKVCSNSTRLSKFTNESEMYLDKKRVLEFLMQYDKRIVDLLTTVSGEVKVTSEGIRFAGAMLGIEEDKQLSVVIDLVHALDLFECHQEVYNSIGRKQGIVSFNPKLALSPEVLTKEIKSDMSILAETLFGGLHPVSISYFLIETVKADAGIPLCESILSDKVASRVDIENTYISRLLDIAERESMSEYFNPKFVQFVRSYLKKGLMRCASHSKGFFDSYRVDVIKRTIDRVSNNHLLYSEEFVDVFQTADKLLFSESCVYMPLGSESFFIHQEDTVKSPHCDNYETELPLSWINHDLGYVGDYVSKVYLMENKLTSRYNPVIVYTPKQLGSQIMLDREEYYNVGWLQSEDGSVYESQTWFLMPAFSFEDFMFDEECSTEGVFKAKAKQLIVGSEAYREQITSDLVDTVRVQCDGELCPSSYSLDKLNSLDSGNFEQFLDMDGLISYYI